MGKTIPQSVDNRVLTMKAHKPGFTFIAWQLQLLEKIRLLVHGVIANTKASIAQK